MYVDIDSIVICDNWELVPRKSTNIKEILPPTWSFIYNNNPESMTRKYKTILCVGGSSHKRVSSEPLNTYSLVL